MANPTIQATIGVNTDPFVQGMDKLKEDAEKGMSKIGKTIDKSLGKKMGAKFISKSILGGINAFIPLDPKELGNKLAGMWTGVTEAAMESYKAQENAERELVALREARFNAALTDTQKIARQEREILNLNRQQADIRDQLKYSQMSEAEQAELLAKSSENNLDIEKRRLEVAQIHAKYNAEEKKILDQVAKMQTDVMNENEAATRGISIEQVRYEYAQKDYETKKKASELDAGNMEKKLEADKALLEFQKQSIALLKAKEKIDEDLRKSEEALAVKKAGDAGDELKIEQEIADLKEKAGKIHNEDSKIRQTILNEIAAKEIELSDLQAKKADDILAQHEKELDLILDAEAKERERIERREKLEKDAIERIADLRETKAERVAKIEEDMAEKLKELEQFQKTKGGQATVQEIAQTSTGIIGFAVRQGLAMQERIRQRKARGLTVSEAEFERANAYQDKLARVYSNPELLSEFTKKRNKYVEDFNKAERDKAMLNEVLNKQIKKIEEKLSAEVTKTQF